MYLKHQADIQIAIRKEVEEYKHAHRGEGYYKRVLPVRGSVRNVPQPAV